LGANNCNLKNKNWGVGLKKIKKSFKNKNWGLALSMGVTKNGGEETPFLMVPKLRPTPLFFYTKRYSM
jgi:hypothetical protein